MNVLRSTGALVVGILPLVVGCAPRGSDLADEEVGVAKQAEGGATNNGADPEMNEYCKPAIFSALHVPLVTHDGNNQEVLNPQLDPTLAAGEKCEQPLHEAYRCAGATNTSLPGPPGAFDGEQLMSTATSWRTAVGGLNYDQQVDVLTCMTTLLNPNAGVPICLEGLSVSAGPSCSQFIVDEAVWLAVPDPTGGVTRYVWPLIDHFTCQPGILAEILRQRVCGPEESAEDCGLVIRTNMQECTLQNGYYTCLGQRAIKTRLMSGGFQTMYAGCSDPQ